MANSFNLGDVVELKSGGPPMTIDALPGVPKLPYKKADDYLCILVQGSDSRTGRLWRAPTEDLGEAGIQMKVSEAAKWMADRFEDKGFLYQEEAASHLLHLHDEALAYFDDSGNVCIGKSVLAAFNKLTSDAVYERSEKFWRHRLPSDQPGRQQ